MRIVTSIVLVLVGAVFGVAIMAAASTIAIDKLFEQATKSPSYVNGVPSPQAITQLPLNEAEHEARRLQQEANVEAQKQQEEMRVLVAENNHSLYMQSVQSMVVLSLLASLGGGMVIVLTYGLLVLIRYGVKSQSDRKGQPDATRE